MITLTDTGFDAWCDTPGCPENTSKKGKYSISEASGYLIKAGWSVDGACFCPQCVEDAADNQKELKEIEDEEQWD